MADWFAKSRTISLGTVFKNTGCFTTLQQKHLFVLHAKLIFIEFLCSIHGVAVLCTETETIKDYGKNTLSERIARNTNGCWHISSGA